MWAACANSSNKKYSLESEKKKKCVDGSSAVENDNFVIINACWLAIEVHLCQSGGNSLEVI